MPAVHPRWRGEHHIGRSKQAVGGGSSPLARGTLVQGEAPLAQARFIPAGAGNTQVQRREGGVLSVHPRWRGEHFGGVGCAVGDGGSSPLARGTHLA